ncbi:MAG: hypothetical protein QM763_12270 [Agriterribacter sp.]
MPDEQRFSKRLPAASLNLPVQITILPDGNILISVDRLSRFALTGKKTERTSAQIIDNETKIVLSAKDENGQADNIIIEPDRSVCRGIPVSLEAG